MLMSPGLSKRGNSPYWIAAFDVVQPDGSVRRFKKSTKRRKRSEAMVEAIRLEELERKGHVSHPEAASKSYVILSEAAAVNGSDQFSVPRIRTLSFSPRGLGTGRV